jgi:hypothetical protein
MAVIPALTTLPALVLAFSVADPAAQADAAHWLSESSDADVVALIDEPAQQSDDEPDILLMSLLTVGVAAAAAVLALIGYFIRNRVGFWLHRPPPRKESSPDEHH